MANLSHPIRTCVALLPDIERMYVEISVVNLSVIQGRGCKVIHQSTRLGSMMLMNAHPVYY